ncbi:hypothetical protein HFD98_11360 [Pseudomonas sp. EKM23D]|uniref:hypothetical protein n=1 Tax=Pseudomonas TaxID=286 RepID=UPI00142E4075|nr:MULTISPECIES: hypothetical protein [Pseudomonas]KAF6692192.1 hypothetical protein HFD98_11360 [Pseudomonas sp. EKM23D]QKJ72041.1 hypothetical protein HRH33_05495 [Pseudomonas rhodesiae]
MKEAPTFAFCGAKGIGNGPVPSLERDKRQKFHDRCRGCNKTLVTFAAIKTLADAS